jgi:hypothetical protein
MHADVVFTGHYLTVTPRFGDLVPRVNIHVRLSTDGLPYR